MIYVRAKFLLPMQQLFYKIKYLIYNMYTDNILYLIVTLQKTAKILKYVLTFNFKFSILNKSKEMGA